MVGLLWKCWYFKYYFLQSESGKSNEDFTFIEYGDETTIKTTKKTINENNDTVTEPTLPTTWAFNLGLISIWQNLEPNLANFCAIGPILMLVNWQLLIDQLS